MPSYSIAMMPPVIPLLVGLAGGAGVLARYVMSSPVHGDALPMVTLAINVAGSFLLGLLVSSHTFGEDVRTVVGVGFLGGFTTFSTFSVQVVLDIEAGEPTRAFFYAAASVLLGLAAAAGGYYLGRAAL